MKNRFLKKRSTGNQNSKLFQHLLLIIAIVSLFIGTISLIHIASAANNDIPPGKQKILDQQQQKMATARAKPGPPKQTHPTPPPAQPAPQRQAGIVDTHEGPFPSSQFIVRNGWQGPVGSNWELVYAGVRMNPTDMSQGPGALRIYTETVTATGGFDVNYVGIYVAPNNESPLTITAVNGSLMQLRTDTGKTLTFNLQTNQYS